MKNEKNYYKVYIHGNLRNAFPMGRVAWNTLSPSIIENALNDKPFTIINNLSLDYFVYHSWVDIVTHT